MARICYQFDREIEEDDLDLSLLEISLKNGIPHVHACGGNGRCSTCRVLILESTVGLEPRNAIERRLAEQKGFEPNIRLACQARTRGDVAIRRLVRDDLDVRLATTSAPPSSGREARLAILFSDVRGFTSLSEKNLPYDIIHVLDRLFVAQGDAILANGGFIDKYIGDGLMALFGLDGGDENATCLAAVRAAVQIQAAMEMVNAAVVECFGSAIDIGIGIHFGQVVVGEVGHPKKRQFTAIGDAVNTASRVESATKQFGAKILASQSVRDRVGSAVRFGTSCAVELKGKAGVFPLFEVLQIENPSDPGR